MIINQKTNRTANFELWSEEQLHMLHCASLEILERTGIVVHDKEGRDLLKDGGAIIKDDNVVKIPAHMVEEAIRTAPSKITFANRDGSRKMHLHRNHIYYGLGTDLPTFTDPYTHEIRPTVLNDIYNVSKVGQYCENIDFVANLGLASDVDQRVSDLYQYKALRTYCNKPNWTIATDAGNVKAMIDMAAVSAGGYDELKLNPTIGHYAEPISPLVCSEEAVQKLLLCAEYEIPVTWASGITAGTTGPVSLASCLALGNAEGLAGLVMHQLKKKGAPFIYGIVFSAVDMRAITSPYGTPEANLGHMVVGQMGRFYNLPSYGTAGCSDSNVVDAQAGIEGMFTNFAAALGGTNLIHDNGYLGSGLIGSLEMVLLDDEIISYVKHFMNSIDINEESLALDLIHEVGHGGEFISHKHTFKNYKKELYHPKYLNRKQYQAWQSGGCKTINKTLEEKVHEIIEKETAPLLTEHELKLYEEIIKDRAREVELAGRR
jgi:trimethylamine--corrinoid protein Co-methyltransferase